MKEVIRFNDICRAITQYQDAGLEINVKWIEELNELINITDEDFKDYLDWAKGLIAASLNGA